MRRKCRKEGEEFLFTPDCILSWSYLKFSLTNVLIPNSESILFLQEWDFCKSQGPLALQAVKQNQACKILSAEAIFSVGCSQLLHVRTLAPLQFLAFYQRQFIYRWAFRKWWENYTWDVNLAGGGKSRLKWFLSSAVYTEEAKNQIIVLIMLPLLTRV